MVKGSVKHGESMDSVQSRPLQNLEAPEGYTLEEAEKLGILQEQKSEIVKPLDETQEADEKGILEER